LLYLPEKRQKPAQAILYIDSEGKSSLADPNNFLREKLNKGTAILAIDVRGAGETKDSLPYRYKSYMANEDWVNEMLAMHIGKPLMGQRVGDVISALDIMVQISDIDPTSIELVAAGWCGPVALHAAAIDERIKQVTLNNSITTWMTLLNNPLLHNRIRLVVPNALKFYDLPDLIKVISPRVVIIKNPIDLNGKISKNCKSL